MHNQRRREVAAGLFLFFGLLILLFGISWLKDYWALRNTYPVQVKFYDIGGVRENDPVDVAGVVKGKVTGLEIKKNYILTTLHIEEDIEIPLDSRITMRTRSIFTGEKYIKVDLGQSEEVASNHPQHLFTGSYISDFSLEHLQRTLIRMDTLLSQLEMKGVQQALEQGIGDFFTEAEKGIEPITARSQEIGRSVDQLASATQSLDSILTRLERGEGSAGRLMTDDTLYRDLRQTTGELKVLIQDIRENPDKYLNVEVKVF